VATDAGTGAVRGQYAREAGAMRSIKFAPAPLDLLIIAEVRQEGRRRALLVRGG
jgi:hypothetical protein